MFTTCCALPLQLTDSSELAPIAFELATGSGRTVYNCLYLALAAKAGWAPALAKRRAVHVVLRVL